MHLLQALSPFAWLVLLLLAAAWGVRMLRELGRARVARAARDEHLAATARCEFCLNWDHDLGQRSIVMSPTFHRVAQVRTPAEMAEQFERDAQTGDFKRDEKGERIPIAQSLDLRRLRWEDLGGCVVHNSGRFRTDTCSSFNRDVDATDGKKTRLTVVAS